MVGKERERKGKGKVKETEGKRNARRGGRRGQVRLLPC